MSAPRGIDIKADKKVDVSDICRESNVIRITSGLKVTMRLIAWENPDTISLTICQSPLAHNIII